MTCRTKRALTAVVAALVLSAAGPQAQSALRIRGTTTANGQGVAATVEAEAVHGFRGDQFVGQKTFKARSQADGRWTVLGITGGTWTFAAHTPSHFPQVVALPVQFAQRNLVSAVGGQTPWEVGFELVPREAHPSLVPAVNAVMNGDRTRLSERLASVFETGAPDELITAGELALYVRETGVARALFQQALIDAPGLARAHLGLASAALIDGHWEGAAQGWWTARERGVSPRLARAVGAAISELLKLGGPLDRFRCPGGLPGC
jgi:hypothetical protein